MLYSVHETTFLYEQPVTAMNTLQSNSITQNDIDDVNVKSIQTLRNTSTIKIRTATD